MLIISDRSSSSALAGGESPQILSRASKSTAIEGLRETYKDMKNYTSKSSFLLSISTLPVSIILLPGSALASFFVWNNPDMSILLGMLAVIFSPLLVLEIGAIRNRKLSKKFEALQKQAHIEIEALGDELKSWLREHYDLELTDAKKFVLSALEIYEPYDADEIWELKSDTGARLNVRINIREDGSLEIHRAEISTPGESSLLEPIR